MFEDEDHQIRPKISYRTSLDYDMSVLRVIEPNLLNNKLTAMPIKTLAKGNGKNSNCGVSLTTSKHSTSTKSKSSMAKVPRSNSLTYRNINKY